MQIKKEMIEKLEECFRLYDTFLVNKDFLIVYNQENKYKTITLSFLKENFLHLTGIKGVTPRQFYRGLKSKKLREEYLEVTSFTESKLSVFKEMLKIFKEKSKIGTYDNKNKYHKNLSIDKGMALTIPESDAVLGIRFINNKIAVPVSLLKQELEKITIKETITDVVCLLEKDIKEKKYSRIIINTISLMEIVENNEIVSLLSDDILKDNGNN